MGLCQHLVGLEQPIKQHCWCKEFCSLFPHLPLQHCLHLAHIPELGGFQCLWTQLACKLGCIPAGHSIMAEHLQWETAVHCRRLLLVTNAVCHSHLLYCVLCAAAAGITNTLAAASSAGADGGYEQDYPRPHRLLCQLPCHVEVADKLHQGNGVAASV